MDDNATKRLFFALWPTEPTLGELTKAVCRLQPEINARLMKPANLCMTLAFLGDVEHDRLNDLVEAADKVWSARFELLLDRIEHWPKPQVICLNPSAPSPRLEQLAADLAASRACPRCA